MKKEQKRKAIEIASRIEEERINGLIAAVAKQSEKDAAELAEYRKNDRMEN